MINDLNILVLEDDDILRYGIETVLRRNDYQNIVAVRNEKEAIISCKEQSIDMAVLDIMIEGGKEGFNVARELKKHNVPFIFLTGSAAPEIIDEAVSLCPYAYLIKPVNTDELVANIKLHSKKLLTDTKNENSIFVKGARGHESIIVSDIIYISSQNVYLELHLKSGRKIVVRSYMNDFLTTLKNANILKVHRSYAVNISAITSVNGCTLLVGQKEIPISKTYKDALYKILDIS